MPKTPLRTTCVGCYKVETANGAGICGRCMRWGITTAQPKPPGALKIKRHKPKRIRQDAPPPPKPKSVYTFLFG